MDEIQSMKAARFFDELLAEHETITGIADLYGARTLADLMYLQAAILKGTGIDHYPDESAILAVISNLPGKDEWVKYIQLVEGEKAVAANPSAIKIVVDLDGGRVENVIANVPIIWTTQDEPDGCGDDEIVTRPNVYPGRNAMEVYRSRIYEGDCFPETVEQIFSVIQSEGEA